MDEQRPLLLPRIQGIARRLREATSAAEDRLATSEAADGARRAVSIDAEVPAVRRYEGQEDGDAVRHGAAMPLGVVRRSLREIFRGGLREEEEEEEEKDVPPRPRTDWELLPEPHPRRGTNVVTVGKAFELLGFVPSTANGDGVRDDYTAAASGSQCNDATPVSREEIEGRRKSTERVCKLRALNSLVAARHAQLARETQGVYRRWRQVEEQLHKLCVASGGKGDDGDAADLLDAIECTSASGTGSDNARRPLFLTGPISREQSKNVNAHPCCSSEPRRRADAHVAWVGSNFHQRTLQSLYTKLRMKATMTALRSAAAVSSMRTRLVSNMALGDSRSVMVAFFRVLEAEVRHSRQQQAVAQSARVASMERRAVLACKRWAARSRRRNKKLFAGIRAHERVVLLATMAHWKAFLVVVKERRVKALLATVYHRVRQKLMILLYWFFDVKRTRILKATLASRLGGISDGGCGHGPRRRRDDDVPLKTYHRSHAHDRAVVRLQRIIESHYREMVDLKLGVRARLPREKRRFAASEDDVRWAASSASIVAMAYKMARRDLVDEERLFGRFERRFGRQSAHEHDEARGFDDNDDDDDSGSNSNGGDNLDVVTYARRPEYQQHSEDDEGSDTSQVDEAEEGEEGGGRRSDASAPEQGPGIIIATVPTSSETDEASQPQRAAEPAPLDIRDLAAAREPASRDDCHANHASSERETDSGNAVVLARCDDTDADGGDNAVPAQAEIARDVADVRAHVTAISVRTVTSADGEESGDTRAEARGEGAVQDEAAGSNTVVNASDAETALPSSTNVNDAATARAESSHTSDESTMSGARPASSSSDEPDEASTKDEQVRADGGDEAAKKDADTDVGCAPSSSDEDDGISEDDSGQSARNQLSLVVVAASYEGGEQGSEGGGDEVDDAKSGSRGGNRVLGGLRRLAESHGSEWRVGCMIASATSRRLHVTRAALRTRAARKTSSSHRQRIRRRPVLDTTAMSLEGVATTVASVRLMSVTFKSWKASSADRGTITIQARLHAECSVVSRHFLGWRSILLVNRMCARTASDLRLMHRAFHGMLARMRYEARVLDFVLRLTATIRMRSLSRTFGAWHALVARQRSVLAFVNERVQRLLSSCFMQWRLEEMENRCVRPFVSRWIAVRCLHAWRERARRRALLRRVFSRADVAWEDRLDAESYADHASVLWDAFKQWQYRALASVERRILYRKAQLAWGFWCSRTRVRVFAALQCAVDLARESRGARRVVLLRAFVAWLSHVELLKSVVAFCFRRVHAIFAGCFEQWRTQTMESRCVRPFVTRWAVARHFVAWRECIRRRALLHRVFSRALVAWEDRLGAETLFARGALHDALRAWSHVARDGTLFRMSRVAWAFWRSRTQSRVLVAFRHAVAASRESDRNRRRALFRSFVAWHSHVEHVKAVFIFCAKREHRLVSGCFEQWRLEEIENRRVRPFAARWVARRVVHAWRERVSHRALVRRVFSRAELAWETHLDLRAHFATDLGRLSSAYFAAWRRAVVALRRGPERDDDDGRVTRSGRTGTTTERRRRTATQAAEEEGPQDTPAVVVDAESELADMFFASASESHGTGSHSSGESSFSAYVDASSHARSSTARARKGDETSSSVRVQDVLEARVRGTQLVGRAFAAWLMYCKYWREPNASAPVSDAVIHGLASDTVDVRLLVDHMRGKWDELDRRPARAPSLTAVAHAAVTECARPLCPPLPWRQQRRTAAPSCQPREDAITLLRQSCSSSYASLSRAVRASSDDVGSFPPSHSLPAGMPGDADASASPGSIPPSIVIALNEVRDAWAPRHAR